MVGLFLKVCMPGKILKINVFIKINFVEFFSKDFNSVVVEIKAQENVINWL
jgi:hypothetical protein